MEDREGQGPQAPGGHREPHGPLRGVPGRPLPGSRRWGPRTRRRPILHPGRLAAATYTPNRAPLRCLSMEAPWAADRDLTKNLPFETPFDWSHAMCTRPAAARWPGPPGDRRRLPELERHPRVPKPRGKDRRDRIHFGPDEARDSTLGPLPPVRPSPRRRKAI